MKAGDHGGTGAAPALGRGRSLALPVREPLTGDQFESTLSAARTGAEWAWTNLYRQVAPVVLGYLRAQRVPEPEDLTAEVFYQVVKSLRQFEGGEGEFRSWVLVIAHRKLIDDYRYRRRRPAEPAAAEVLESRTSSGNVEDEALDRLDEAQFARLLDGLTTEQKDVLLLRMLGGLSVPEVAAAIGKRPGAVQAMQQRALATLRKLMA